MTENKILSQHNLISQVNHWKGKGSRVVFTNGCFDILHLGHIDYLEKAAAFGDKLVVGLNTDDSIKRLKGNDRPINPAFARARILAALEFVDAVTFFDEDTPLSLIKLIVPDILTKGSDYALKDIVGAEFVTAQGGEVGTIDLVEGYATSNIISKIQNQIK